jgi:hypothetical protein
MLDEKLFTPLGDEALPSLAFIGQGCAPSSDPAGLLSAPEPVDATSANNECGTTTQSGESVGAGVEPLTKFAHWAPEPVVSPVVPSRAVDSR